VHNPTPVQNVVERQEGGRRADGEDVLGDEYRLRVRMAYQGYPNKITNAAR
jgi:hypothetical protein